MSAKFEAPPKSSPKGDDGYHRVLIHKGPQGADTSALGQKLDEGYVIDEEKNSYVIVKMPKDDAARRQSEAASRFLGFDSHNAGVEGETIVNEVKQVRLKPSEFPDN
jgi:hypothetical protein